MTTPHTTGGLPPIKANHSESNEDRRFYTALSGSDYLKLEHQSMARGLKPYGFVKIILQLFLNGEMVALSELPEDVAQKIRAYIKTKQEKQRGQLDIQEIKSV